MPAYLTRRFYVWAMLGALLTVVWPTSSSWRDGGNTHHHHGDLPAIHGGPVKFRTANSTYEIDTQQKRIRRLAGVNDPTPTIAVDGEWRPYLDVVCLQIAYPAIVRWNEEKALRTSVVTAIEPDVEEPCVPQSQDDDELNLDEILRKHRIPLTYRQAFTRLIESGEIINAEFRIRLNTDRHFQACADEVLQTFPQPQGDFVPEQQPDFGE
jgi:hypothetical protein